MWGQISFRQTSNCLTENICTWTVQNSNFCLIVSAEVISGDEKIRDQWTKTNQSRTRENEISDRTRTSKYQTLDRFRQEPRKIKPRTGSTKILKSRVNLDGSVGLTQSAEWFKSARDLTLQVNSISYLSSFDSFPNPEAQILNSWMHEEVEKFISYYYPDHKEYENMNKGKPTWRMTPKLVEIHQKFEILDSFNSFKTRNNSIRCLLSCRFKKCCISLIFHPL